MLQDYLGEDSEAGIVAYVRRHRLMLGGPPALRPEEGSYFAPPWHSDHMIFRPHAPRDLRDCAHWKVVLRLIAAANCGEAMRRQVCPVQETVTPVYLEMLPPSEVRQEIDRLERRLQELRGQQRCYGRARRRRRRLH